MKTYRLIARPDIRLAVHGLLPLTEYALVQEISDIVVRELSETHFGWQVVDVELRRQNDAEALDEIVATLERLGFSLVEATASKWATAMAGKMVGAVGGFAVGAGVSENLAVGLVTSAIGTFVGHLVGDAARQIVASYEAHRDHRGIWVFEEISRQPSMATDLRLATSPA